MRNRKGYFNISTQRKKGCVKMALGDLWKEKKEKDRRRGEKTDKRDEYNFRAKYDRSMQLWSSFSRIKGTTASTNDGDKCSVSLPFLEDSKNKDSDVQDKEDLSNSENTGKILKLSNKENKKVHADTTSEMVPKSSNHNTKHRVSNSQSSTRKIKFEQKMNERRRHLLNKYKIKRQNHESTNKMRYASNNASEIILISNKTDKIQIPVQIDKEKLQISSIVGLSEKKINKSKSSYYKSETMEADSTVPSDKKDDIHIYNNKNTNKPKDVFQYDLHQSVTANKFQDDFNVPTAFNQNDLNKKGRKRKRIKEKFRYYFGECLTISEEEEEESILDSYMYKRHKNDFNEILNDSTNVESHTASNMPLNETEAQDTTINVVMCEDTTNNIVFTKTFKIKKVKQIETVSNITSPVECNNVETTSDSDVFPLQNESLTDKSVHTKETVKSTSLDNDEQIQTNLSNEFNSANNVEENYVEEPSTFQKSINIEKNVLPDSNINNDNCNADSDDLGTTAKVLNLTLDSASFVEKVLEIPKSTESQSQTLQEYVSVDTTEKRKSVLVENINFTKSHIKNINDSSVDIRNKEKPCTETSKCTMKNFAMSPQNVITSVSQVDKQCTRHLGEDLNQLLQIDVNQNHRIQSDGNTISIQEDLEKDSNQNVMVKDICISNVTNKANEITSEHSVSKTKERLLENHSTMVTDIGLTENINTCNVQNKDEIVIPILSDEEAILTTNNNTVDNTSPIVSDTLLDCNSENTNNFKQPETTQSNKIRVLSSAELGSRWCPTPVNNSTSSSVTEPKLSNHTIMELLNDSQPCKDSTKSTKESIPDHVQWTLIYIYSIMIRIRSIVKKYTLNNYQDMSPDNQKKLSDDEQFKSNFTVLLQEFVNLGKELKRPDTDLVVQYAMDMINKHYKQPEHESIMIHELSFYIKVMNLKLLKSAATTSSNNASVLDRQSTNLGSTYTATTKPIPSVSNNPNVVPATLSYVPNLYVPVVPQGHIAANNLPKQNIYVSNVSNQNHEYNISNVQAMPTSNASTSYIPSVQQSYKNVQLLPENRTSSINAPYYQHLIQQQSFPVVAINNVPNVNIVQLQNNVHVQRMNMHPKPQEALISNKSELLKGQSSTPQKLPQQTIPQRSQKPQGPQIYMAGNSKNIQVSSSTSLSMHLPNIPPRTNAISHELVFKIWDQVTYCLEQEIINYRLHNSTFFLESFSKKWKKSMNNFMYQRMRSQNNELIRLHSREAQFMFCRLRKEQLLLKNKELQNQSRLINILNETTKRKNLESPVNVKSRNEMVQSEVTQHKPRKSKKKVEHEKQQQSQDQSNLQLLNNVVASVSKEVLNASENNNSVLVESNFINSDNTMVLSHKKDNVENVNVTNSTSLERKTEKQQNMLKTNEVTSLKNNIQVIQDLHRKEESLLTKQTIEERVVHVQKETSLLEQTAKKVVHTQEEISLHTQTVTEGILLAENKTSLLEQTAKEVVHTQEEILLAENKTSLLEQTAKEVVHTQEEILLAEEETSLLEQTAKEVVHTQEEILLAEEETSLLEQTAKEVVHTQEEILLTEEETSLLEQTAEEVVHTQEILLAVEETSLLEQTAKEVVHTQEESSLLKQTITEEILLVQEENSLTEQTIKEVVHMQEESSLPQQIIGEAVHGKDQSSLIEQIIRNNNNYLQCDSIQSVTLLDPHIVDVRSISLTSFNKMENTFAPNDSELPLNEDTENNEIKVKIEIPEDVYTCLQCSNTSTVVCEACLQAHYCSKECAKSHWFSEHHKDCKPSNNDDSTTEDTDFDVNHTNVP